MIQSYMDLDVYHRSMDVLVEVHQLLHKFPAYELNELCSQMRRASKSIPCNIAEGYGKKRSVKEFVSYLAIAMGSANEMVVHLEVSSRLGYIPGDVSKRLQEEYNIIGKMLNRLSQRWIKSDESSVKC